MSQLGQNRVTAWNYWETIGKILYCEGGRDFMIVVLSSNYWTKLLYVIFFFQNFFMWKKLMDTNFILFVGMESKILVFAG